MGEPDDVDGECNAHLYIADNFSDNHATMRCELRRGHTGKHQETFRSNTCVVLWEEDERDYDRLPLNA